MDATRRGMKKWRKCSANTLEYLKFCQGIQNRMSIYWWRPLPVSLSPTSLPPGPNSRATSTACSSAGAGSGERADSGEQPVKRSRADAHHQQRIYAQLHK